MAFINGITIKSVKRTFGHEGELLYSGTIYCGNQKIGHWAQDAWSGPDVVHLEKPYSPGKLNAAIAKANPDKAISGNSKSGKSYEIPYDIELLMADLILLKSDEKEFNKALREGYHGLFIYSDGYHCNYWYLPKKYTAYTDEQLKAVLSAEIEVAKKEFFKETPGHEHIVRVYRSQDDFSIGSKITLKEITE